MSPLFYSEISAIQLATNEEGKACYISGVRFTIT